MTQYAHINIVGVVVVFRTRCDRELVEPKVTWGDMGGKLEEGGRKNGILG